MTRVVVDLLFHTGSRGGMESYVRELYTGMPAVAPDLELVALGSREFAAGAADWFPGEVVDSGVAAADRTRWAWGELSLVAGRARELRADVLHAPANVGPWRSSVPVLLTVHDLLPFRHPEWVPGPYAPVLRALIRGAARAATRIATVSDASRDDIHRLLRIDAGRIDVTPLAGSGPASGATAEDRDRRTLIAVANDLPHKNLDLLLDALGDPRLADWRLEIFGASAGGLADRVATRGLGNVDVRGWVTADELERAYRRAAALVLPTLFEGFGLPVLEAMSRGCPVICTDLPVLREVGGAAPLYVRPGSADGIVDSVLRLDAEGTDRTAAGTQRAAEFTWSRTADLTAAALRAVAAG